MKTIEEKIKKLPQWAQDYISNLEHKLDSDTKYYKEKLFRVYNGKSPITIHSHEKRKRYLPEATISFKLGEDWNDVVTVRIDDRAKDTLLVYSTKLLVIKAVASNSISVKLDNIV